MIRMAKLFELIAIDDGHGMNTAGKRTPTLPNGEKSETGKFMHENEFNRSVAKLFEKELKRCGFGTLMVAPTDEDTPLEKRTTLANNKKADLYISIHANANTGKFGSWGGIETFAWNSGDGYKYAQIMQKELIKGSKLQNRGVKDGSHLWVIRKTNMIALLVELGFMDSHNDYKFLLSDAYRKECARELAQGVCKIYGRKYIAESKEDKAEPVKTETSKETSKEIGTLKVLVNELWYYDKPDWNAKKAKVNKGEVFTVVEELKVNGSKMYKLKSGTYITGATEYVKFTKK